MTVRYEANGNVGVITLDDGAKNVINHGVLDELEAAWAQTLGDDAVGAVVLTGRDGSFCAGYDINVMTGGDAEAAAELGCRGGRFGYGLYASEKPVVALSTGHAFTIGVVWLACADVRIGVDGPFKYAVREVALNVPLSRWPLAPLRERLVPEAMIPALLHSRIYNPAEAKEAGFLDEVATVQDGMAQALATAAALAELPRHAYAITKRQMRESGLKAMAEDLGIT